jgi:hypothetical protein
VRKVVNLNRFRKQKARAEADKQAAENRVRFGRSKAEKAREAAVAEEARRKLDQLRRDPSSEPPTD